MTIRHLFSTSTTITMASPMYTSLTQLTSNSGNSTGLLISRRRTRQCCANTALASSSLSIVQSSFVRPPSSVNLARSRLWNPNAIALINILSGHNLALFFSVCDNEPGPKICNSLFYSWAFWSSAAASHEINRIRDSRLVNFLVSPTLHVQSIKNIRHPLPAPVVPNGT